jgi:hypothetical protein
MRRPFPSSSFLLRLRFTVTPAGVSSQVPDVDRNQLCCEGCMKKIAQMTTQERADVFTATAERKGLCEAIIEQDFWLSWDLKQLFIIETFSG